VTRRPPRRLLRAAAPVVLAAAALVTVAACGDATPDQTKEHSTVAGLNTSVGDVLIRDAQIEINPDDTSGELLVALFNQGSGSDELTSVTSPRATFTLPSTSDVSATPAPASDTSGTSATSSGVTLDVGAGVFLDEPPSSIEMSGVSGDPLQLGDLVPVTLTFAAAGSTTISVPVTEDAIPSPYGEETTTPAPSQAGAYADTSPAVSSSTPPDGIDGSPAAP
jgi:copper(I)-binding protein